MTSTRPPRCDAGTRAVYAVQQPSAQRASRASVSARVPRREQRPDTARANPSRGGDAKSEVSEHEIARPPVVKEALMFGIHVSSIPAPRRLPFPRARCLGRASALASLALAASPAATLAAEGCPAVSESQAFSAFNDSNWY